MYPEPSQTSKMEIFVKIVQGWNLLAIEKSGKIKELLNGTDVVNVE